MFLEVVSTRRFLEMDGREIICAAVFLVCLLSKFKMGQESVGEFLCTERVGTTLTTSLETRQFFHYRKLVGRF